MSMEIVFRGILHLGLLLFIIGATALSAAVAHDEKSDQSRLQALVEELSSGKKIPAEILLEMVVSDSSADVRLVALEALGSYPEGKDIAKLALNDPSIHVRKKAREILGENVALSNRGDTPVIDIKGGRAINVRVRNAPLELLLEEISEKGSVGIIRSEDLGEQQISVQINDLPLDEALRQILKDNDAFFFYSGEDKSPASLKGVWVYPRGRAQGLQPVPPEKWASTKELEGKLADPDIETRARAFEEVVKRIGTKAPDTLIEGLKDKDNQVRIRTLWGALSSGVELPTDFLSSLAVKDGSPEIRFLALQALASRPEIRAVAEKLAVNDPDPNVRNKAQEILLELGVARQTSEPSDRQSKPGGR